LCARGCACASIRRRARCSNRCCVTRSQSTRPHSGASRRRLSSSPPPYRLLTHRHTAHSNSPLRSSRLQGGGRRGRACRLLDGRGTAVAGEAAVCRASPATVVPRFGFSTEGTEALNGPRKVKTPQSVYDMQKFMSRLIDAERRHKVFFSSETQGYCYLEGVSWLKQVIEEETKESGRNEGIRCALSSSSVGHALRIIYSLL